MTNLDPSSTRSSSPRWFPYVFAVVAFLGFLDSVYLAVKHYLGTSLKCPIFGGCDVVTASKYAAVAGIPVALAGAVYYLAILVLVVIYFDSRKEIVLRGAARLTLLGFLATIWLVYLQVFVIKYICFYCMISAITSTLLFVLGSAIIRKRRANS